MSNRFKFRIPYYKENMFVGFVTANVATGESSFIQGCSPKEPEQCTGLKDKNDNFVYENDILIYTVCQNNQDVDVKVIIKWNEDECCFELYHADGNFFGTPRKQNFMIRAKIIGNIHKHKELLS